MLHHHIVGRSCWRHGGRVWQDRQVAIKIWKAKAWMQMTIIIFKENSLWHVPIMDYNSWFKDQLPSSVWAFNTFCFNFKILFSSATVAVRFSSRSLLTGLWRKISIWRTILMKRRNRPYIYCISCIWHLTFVLIVFADWALEKNPPGWRYWWRERIKYTNQPTTRSRPNISPKKIHNKIDVS